MINRKQMKGSEWRNWIIYFAVPCLKGLINQEHITPVELLSHGAFLLSLDNILPENIIEADRCLRQFLDLNEQLYGIEKTKLNLHTLVHFSRSVSENGNLWCYSTFNFESWNHKIIQTVSSPQGALLQILVRHLIYSSLELARHSLQNISLPIRSQLSKIMTKKRMTRAYQFSQHVYLMGKVTIRNTTEQEQKVLQQLGFINIGAVQEYSKISINSSVYCPMKHVKNGSKSDNSLIYTHGDTYCSIESVVRFQTEEGTDKCGLLVSEHQVTNRTHFNVARHISCLLEHANDLPHFVTPEEVRSFVVKMPLHGEMYVVPLPNLYEID
ncbi:Protein transport protein SEC13 [Frankliniella fusca]|uniref:Protein transport protein SEC13 n=1 Tax=Frankliniella fusca TaxID=407009 RepID=A0AAE1HQP4_9NEOP|nr:Protein transport protein SEC13 [Frankliniella fusca]